MSRIRVISTLLNTVPRLGFRNIFRVAFYRVRVRLGWLPKTPVDSLPAGDFFNSIRNDGSSVEIKGVKELLYGWKSVDIVGVPEWHVNPFKPLQSVDLSLDWKESLEPKNVEDPKHYWELSRMYWVPRLAIAFKEGDEDALLRLNEWLSDWARSNPPYQGINWSCGQEASIRLMNLALAAVLLDEWDNPTSPLSWLIEVHARRISSTLIYSIGQDNNHGSAEACALFIAGSWGRLWSMPGAEKMEKSGKYWLSNRVRKLIQTDGSPAQYSLTYHRANLETFCLSSIWATFIGDRLFSGVERERILKGAQWLHSLTNKINGDAPNIGANDGSNLFNFYGDAYRDFRPCVDMCAQVFSSSNAWAAYSDKRATVLGLPSKELSAWSQPVSKSYDEGGFHVLHRELAMAVLRYPRFKFRPSQADALHLDFWIDGENILRDAGTYSYVGEESTWFSGSSAHNTVRFDDREQMPRLGQFLFGNWLKSEDVTLASSHDEADFASAGYTDEYRASHHRTVKLCKSRLVCTDIVYGEFKKAVLRWRLTPRAWETKDGFVHDGAISIKIVVDNVVVAPEVGSAYESRYYYKKSSVPVLSIDVRKPCKIVTTINF